MNLVFIITYSLFKFCLNYLLSPMWVVISSSLPFLEGVSRKCESLLFQNSPRLLDTLPEFILSKVEGVALD